ncbi:hypothetical protein ACIP6P_23060 [Streptomyces sp. NPDC088729]|uniref:hypothetical protein n=1 Tax=Streptomyces sp. NPDC088729 TaxID=3365876 RepID=UPI003814FD0C
MRIGTSLVALSLAAAGVAFSATPATATQHGGGDSGPTAIAVSKGSGSATANAIKTGPITVTNPTTTPPGTGTPGTSSIMITDATLNGATVTIDISYSCPSSLPADTQLFTFTTQLSGALSSTLSDPTCDGTLQTTEIDVTSGTSTPFAPGTATITAALNSPSDQMAPFAQDELNTRL